MKRTPLQSLAAVRNAQARGSTAALSRCLTELRAREQEQVSARQELSEAQEELAQAGHAAAPFLVADFAWADAWRKEKKQRMEHARAALAQADAAVKRAREEHEAAVRQAADAHAKAVATGRYEARERSSAQRLQELATEESSAELWQSSQPRGRR